MQHLIRQRLLAALLIAGVLGTTLDARADCAADATVEDTKRHYARGQELEREGKPRAALAAYVRAQEYTCDKNPVELPAAQRAAALALPLAQAAEQARDFETAYRLYEDGGHFAASDHALVAFVQSKPDDPHVYRRAREVLEYRASPAFQSNSKVRLSVTGAYTQDPRHLAELRKVPGVGAERAFKAEAAAFDEQYLREYVELAQSRPDDPTDVAALKPWEARMQALHRRWPNDPLKASRDALSLAHEWSVVADTPALREQIAAKRRERIEQRIVTLTRSYHRAPELLDAAIDYQTSMHIDDAAKEARVAAIRSQAASLGDEAMSQRRFVLAAEFYRVARLDAKADQAREQQQQHVKAKLQPSMDRMQKQAEELQKAFSDPKAVAQMQEQARQMQKALQEQQQANAKGNAKKADDLERELGL